MNPIVMLPKAVWMPLVASVPHGGDQVPEDISSKLLVDIERNYADWYTPSVYSFLPELGVPTVVATAHRLVADVNRSPIPPIAAPWPKGVVATTSARHEPLYRDPLSEAEVRNRLTLAHTAYHEALDSLVREALARARAIVLLDLHSFGMPLGVDVVVGDRNGSTADSRVVDIIERAFRDSEFSVQRNRPFSGGWILERHAGNRRVHAVIIEINQRVYLDPADIDRENWSRPRCDVERIAHASGRLRTVLSRIIVQLHDLSARR